MATKREPRSPKRRVQGGVQESSRKKDAPPRDPPKQMGPKWHHFWCHGPSRGPEGPIIKEVWLLSRSSYSRIRLFGDLVVQIFGIVFGGAAVRKGVLHADLVGRRIRSKKARV